MKKKLVFITVVIVLSIVSIIAVNYFPNKEVLTSQEIISLREKYPVFDEEIPNPENVIMRKISFEERITTVDTFAYCEVVGDVRYIKVNAGSGHEILDNKLNDMGIDTTLIKYQYPVKIISDTEGLFDEGTEIYYTNGLSNQNYSPAPNIGDKIIIPITVDRYNDLIFSTRQGYYYVTDNDYVLSGYAEDEGFEFTGIKRSELMKKLKKTDKQVDVYNELRKIQNKNFGETVSEYVKRNKDKFK